MLGSADRDAICSLSILLGNHRNALSCAVKPLSLLLPDKYAPCVVPTVPSPKELLSPNWGLSRPREYVKLLEGLVSSWRIFATKREVHVLDDTPSYLASTKDETVAAKDLTESDGNTFKESSCSPPNSPTTSSSSAATAASISAGAAPKTSNEISRGVPDSTENGKERGSSAKRYRKARAYFQPHHLYALESFYKHQTYLSTHDRELLSQRLGLSEDRIRTWFQNRRMKEKRKPRAQKAAPINVLNLSDTYGSTSVLPLGGTACELCQESPVLTHEDASVSTVRTSASRRGAQVMLIAPGFSTP
ncbi:Homeobox protein BarH-like protein [Echinococcus granulosus]|uniref:Homeobox protein BarH-like protein n=1 Tax=Echinococcus granulosus TaxID=6210 RepID=W6UWW4_ECHGR|nr:Homeobox protein BarH-like protein [Echinococcus granulosus]EUB57969.1 Homeobox protein BarH-like protein [Echinococcus granulosus]